MYTPQGAEGARVYLSESDHGRGRGRAHGRPGVYQPVHYLQFISDVRACVHCVASPTWHKRDRAGQRREGSSQRGDAAPNSVAPTTRRRCPLELHGCRERERARRRYLGWQRLSIFCCAGSSFAMKSPLSLGRCACSAQKHLPAAVRTAASASAVTALSALKRRLQSERRRRCGLPSQAVGCLRLRRRSRRRRARCGRAAWARFWEACRENFAELPDHPPTTTTTRTWTSRV